MLELIELKKELTITNPSTGATIETLSETSFYEASQLINEAEKAQIGWAKTPIKERAQVFYQYLELLKNSKEELAKLVPAFLWCEQVTDLGQCIEHLIKGPSTDPSKVFFQFREGHFDRIEIRRVWWQVEEPAADIFQSLRGIFVAVRREIVTDHDGSRQ